MTKMSAASMIPALPVLLLVLVAAASGIRVHYGPEAMQQKEKEATAHAEEREGEDEEEEEPVSLLATKAKARFTQRATGEDEIMTTAATEPDEDDQAPPPPAALLEDTDDAAEMGRNVSMMRATGEDEMMTTTTTEQDDDKHPPAALLEVQNNRSGPLGMPCVVAMDTAYDTTGLDSDGLTTQSSACDCRDACRNNDIIRTMQEQYVAFSWNSNTLKCLCLTEIRAVPAIGVMSGVTEPAPGVGDYCLGFQRAPCPSGSICQDPNKAGRNVNSCSARLCTCVTLQAPPIPR